MHFQQGYFSSSECTFMCAVKYLLSAHSLVQLGYSHFHFLLCVSMCAFKSEFLMKLLSHFCTAVAPWNVSYCESLVHFWNGSSSHSPCTWTDHQDVCMSVVSASLGCRRICCIRHTKLEDGFLRGACSSNELIQNANYSTYKYSILLCLSETSVFYICQAVEVVWHYPREPLDVVLHFLYRLALMFGCMLVLY